MCVEYTVFEHTKHKAIWSWLAENPRARKEDAFAALAIAPPKAHQLCFACKYASECAGESVAYCDACPLVVTEAMIRALPRVCHEALSIFTDDDEYLCLRGLYSVWEVASSQLRAEHRRTLKNLSTVARIEYAVRHTARLIAELPVGDNVLTI